MKQVFLFLGTVLCAATMYAQTSDNVMWKTKTYDFGNIAQGKPMTAVFEFVNTGNKPIVISDLITSCGCTKGEYPQTPIAPGAKASVSAIYNASNAGAFNKTVTVKFNDNSEPSTLIIKGTVFASKNN